MTERIIGYILLTLGILVIIFSGLSVYSVFTGRAKPIEIFHFQSISIDLSQMVKENLPPEATKFMQQGQIRSKPTELLSADVLNDTSNILAHLMLMGFLVSVGFKLAQLGTYLIRPIVVKLKAKEMTAESVS